MYLPHTCIPPHLHPFAAGCPGVLCLFEPLGYEDPRKGPERRRLRELRSGCIGAGNLGVLQVWIEVWICAQAFR